MKQPKVPATIDGLLRARRRLGRVERGRDLLRRKREALVRRLLGLATPLRETRRRIEGKSAEAYEALLEALGAECELTLEAHGWPLRPVDVAIHIDSEWGVPIAQVESRTELRRDPLQRSTPPAGTGLAAIETADRFEELVELLLDVATEEARIERLGQALARTSRQVETLERRVAPDLEQSIHRIRRVLDEREREDKLRRRHLSRVRGQAATSDG